MRRVEGINRFRDQFTHILNDPFVKEQALFLLNQGKNTKNFINYFGVNYNKDNVVSVKLYFSFLSAFPKSVAQMFSIPNEFAEKIQLYWKPSDQYEYFHQGLTFGLKCYLTPEDRVRVNHYAHFRSENLPKKYPLRVTLEKEDLKQTQGVCYERHKDNSELKQYYYITSQSARMHLFDQYGLSNNQLQHVPMIEYTESDLESKINMIFNGSDYVDDYLRSSCENSNILELSKFFFQNYNLYFFCPGKRKNSTTRALYFVPREVYTMLYPLQTLNKLFF